MSKNLIASVGLALCFGLLTSGCKTIEGRVRTHPFAYGALSLPSRNLILKGQIQSGFHKSAVYLAWGRPDQIRRGVRRGHPFEVWIYTMSQGEMVRRNYPPLHGYGDYHYDSSGPYRHWSRFGISDVGSDVNAQGNDANANQIPYKTAFFENGVCTGWEFR